MIPRPAAHQPEACESCGSARARLELVEHALSAGRALVVGGGILTSTFLLTAAMAPGPAVSAGPAPAPVAACRSLAALELPPPAPVPPLPSLSAAGTPSVASLRRASLGARPTASEGSAALSGAALQLARGDAAYNAGQYWSALRRYLLAAKQDPSRPEAHFGVALARFELLDDRGSRRALRRALRLDPGHPLSHLLLGALDRLEGDSAAARGHYQRYLQLEPAGSFAGEVRALLDELPGQSLAER